MARCPACGEFVEARALTCIGCGARFPGATSITPARTRATGRRLHGAVIIFFALALLCYAVGSTTGAVVFSVIGVFMELAAWVTLFAKDREK